MANPLDQYDEAGPGYRWAPQAPLQPPAAPKSPLDQYDPPKPSSTWTGWAKDAITGRTRTEFPEAPEFHKAINRGGVRPEEVQSMGDFDLTAVNRSGITPDPQAQLDILKKHIPGLESQKDRYGNVMLRAPQFGVGEWTYLNKPGISARDLEESATQIMATLPFGAVVGLGRSLLARVGIGAAATGGASVAQDVAAGAMGSEQGVDPQRAAVATGVGAFAGPVAGHLADRAARMAPTRAPTMRAEDLAEDAAAFHRLDVPTFGPAFSSGPVASTAKQLAETPVLVGPVRGALERSIAGARDASEDIASRFGTSGRADEAGAVAGEALDRFRDARPTDIVERAVAGYTPAERSAIIAAPARETSLKTKQAALYERAWSLIPEDMQQGRAVRGLPRVHGGMPNSAGLLQEIQQRNLRMINASRDGAEDAAQPIASGSLLGRMVDAMQTPQWRASLQTMRDIRSEFRRLASGMADTEKNVLKASDIERMQSAITRDMIGLLERNVETYSQLQQHGVARNMQRAIVEFRRADQFTRGAAQRMETIERLFNAENPTALYRNITQAALGGTKGDVSKLRVLRKTLRADEMDEIAAYTLRQMGKPEPSARGAIAEIGFSPSTFMTKLNGMEPEARRLIFGHEHVQALNDLGRVVSRLANVEATANTSRSGTNLLNLGGLLATGGAAATGQWEAALGMAGAGALASVVFSRPSYARWAIGYAQLKAAIRQAPAAMSGPMAAHIGRLESMARSDPALLPLLRNIQSENEKSDQQVDNPRPSGDR